MTRVVTSTIWSVRSRSRLASIEAWTAFGSLTPMGAVPLVPQPQAVRPAASASPSARDFKLVFMDSPPHQLWVRGASERIRMIGIRLF